MDTPINAQALPAGTRLEEFVIEGILGSGGFGVTYLARDTSLGRQVVIKENLPAQFCFRDPSSLTVAPRHTTGEDVENFRWSLENFSKEAAMLASLNHPGIVKVLRSFRGFGTAYFVMPFVEGMTLDSLIESRGAKGQSLTEKELCRLLELVLSALGYLHDRGIYHRDIKPGNILITNEGVPVLIDFGSARQRLSERSMTVVESAGYTPFEQLQSRGNVGPWSDLYALGGTLVKALTGEAPPKAMDRMRKDPHQPLAERVELRVQFTQGFLRGIDKSLAVDEECRWQNAEEWLAALQGEITAETPAPDEQCLAETAAKTDKVSTATRTAPYVNSLGMKCVPVKITEEHGFGQKVLFSIWETRVHDYRKFAAGKSEVDGEWTRPGFTQGEDHPVVNVSWEDAVAFCEWLTGQERSAGRISATAKYRLPTDHEWSCAVGIGAREDSVAIPASKNNIGGAIFPWGQEWPPPLNAGNYGGSLNVDSYAYTSPVGSFAANGSGIHDLGGNVWEWCEDWYDDKKTYRVVRGGSWGNFGELSLRSSFRGLGRPSSRGVNGGCRCVLVVSGG